MSRTRKGGTPLQLASFYGHLDTAAVLLEQGCDIDSRDDEVRTALMSAVRCVHNAEITLEIVKLLLQHKAEAEAVDTRGQTPLIHAVIMSNLLLAKCLLDSGANMEARCPSGWTALHWAWRRKRESLVKLL